MRSFPNKPNVAILLLSLLLACASSSKAPSDPIPELSSPSEITNSDHGDTHTNTNQCQSTNAATPTEMATLQTAVLAEASGMVASYSNPNILWMHNDSGDAANLYAISTDGTLVATVEIPGVSPVDIEDIARATCPDGEGSCLWVADIGNNNQDRDVLDIHVAEEIDLSVSNIPSPTRTWRYQYRYPHDPVDSEALVVAPDGSRLWIFEKVDGPNARVYALENPQEETVATLSIVATIPSPGLAIPYGRMITAADLHPSGQRLLIRVYTGSWEYRFDSSLDFENLGAIEPLTVALGPLTEAQGEAICYDNPGTGLWTVSEDPEGAGHQPLHHYPCQD
ncbi:MAG: hypothetical protein CMH54_06415 [Myxococcales bacterium]|nr:hypothetical protein [Myxococcales bacterium]